jgi:hypothetical protein
VFLDHFEVLISRKRYNIIFLLLRKVPIIISLDLAELFGIIIIILKKNKKNIILIYFLVKNTLKNNNNHTLKSLPFAYLQQ